MRIPRLVAFAVVFALPLAANAQVTAHKVKLTLKTVSQIVNNKGQDKPDKFTANWKDVFQACVETSPAKDEGIYLFLNCDALNENVIAIMDTDPVQLIDEIGSVSFDLTRLIQNTKNGLVQSASVPATIQLSCGGAEAEVFGIMDISFKDLDGQQCPNSASVKVTGLLSEPDTGVVDNGSSITAGKRTAAFGGQFPMPVETAQ